MKKLILILLIISGESWAQVTPKVSEHNYKGTEWYGLCIDGVEYLEDSTVASHRIAIPRLKPDGKPVTCNY